MADHKQRTNGQASGAQRRIKEKQRRQAGAEEGARPAERGETGRDKQKRTGAGPNSTRPERNGIGRHQHSEAKTRAGADANSVRPRRNGIGTHKHGEAKTRAGADANSARPERNGIGRHKHSEAKIRTSADVNSVRPGRNGIGTHQHSEAKTRGDAARDGQTRLKSDKPIVGDGRQERGASVPTKRQDEQPRSNDRLASAPSDRSAKRAGQQKDFTRNDSGKFSAGKAAAVSISSAEEVKAGDTVTVTIKRIGINGEGVGYFRRKTIFVPGALPGEVVQAKAVKVENSYIQGTLEHIEKRSPSRVAPPCPVYIECGGCQLQHLSYAGQLAAKEALVREAFERYTGIRELPLRPIFGMDEPWSYRNKAQLQAGRQDGRMITGLYAAGSHRLVDISGCPIQHPGLNRVMREVSRIADELGVPVYDERQHRGVLRTVVARIGWRSQEVQLTLVTASAELPQREALIQCIRQALPEVVTLAQNVHPGKDSLIFGEETNILWGREQLDEELGELRFALSPRAFFQLNPSQTVKLYDAVKEAAALTGRETVVDAYCGTGTIGLWLAPLASEVRGIELIEDAVADARRNAQRSGLTNARFYVDRAERLLPQWVREGLHPDIVVVDPPRTGCDAALLGALLAAKPQRLVYVSCNPSTLAKDCKPLLAGGYRLEWVQPVDMFPQTAHVECVIGLQRIDT